MTEAVRQARRSAPIGTRGRKTSEHGPTAAGDLAGVEASERAMARRVAQIVPVATLLGAGVMGTLTSLGPSILVLAGGALFATIAFFWASLRTLSGDAPLAEGFDQLTRRRIEAGDGAAERKRTALRALKDIELEHSIGKIDDADYTELSARYREQAKAILREMDAEILPRRDRAEQLARAYVAKRGITMEPREDPASSAPEDGPNTSEPRRVCKGCLASNEPDAVYCKGCGARIVPRGCAGCATINEEDAAFCKRCGKSLPAARPETTDAST